MRFGSTLRTSLRTTRCPSFCTMKSPRSMGSYPTPRFFSWVPWTRAEALRQRWFFHVVPCTGWLTKVRGTRSCPEGGHSILWSTVVSLSLVISEADSYDAPTLDGGMEGNAVILGSRRD